MKRSYVEKLDRKMGGIRFNRGNYFPNNTQSFLKVIKLGIKREKVQLMYYKITTNLKLIQLSIYKWPVPFTTAPQPPGASNGMDRR